MSILLCYDGSADAQAAIARAGELFPGHDAVVLTVWEGFTQVLMRAGAGMTAAPLDYGAIDEATQAAARERAEEGVGLARAAGFDARAEIAERPVAIWEAIVDAAGRANAEAIVMGTRGLTGVRSAVLGSVSRGVLHNTDRPVLIVPAEDVAAQRAERLAPGRGDEPSSS